ncbi:MAG: hypothetical protein ABJA02_12860 [Acidobacteriota bacterium]
MEILIVGILLVALMVYASTKIKRTATEAFEQERIETADYIVEKPEGFLNVLHPNSLLELDIYSRDFGVDHAASFRMAKAELRRYKGWTVEQAVDAVGEAVKVNSTLSEVIDGKKYRVIEAESVEKGAGFRELYKLAEKEGDVYELKLQILEDANEELNQKADRMCASFEIK